MSDWLQEDDFSPEDGSARPASVESALRAMDLLLAAVLLAVLGLPMALVAARWPLRRSPAWGRDGQVFQRLSLDLSAAEPGALRRWLLAIGAENWPVLLNIWRGELAWVGPRARAADEPRPLASVLALRPGLANPWFLRRRTAVDFGDEALADQQYLAQRGLRHDLGLLLRSAVVALLPPPVAVVPGRVQVGDVAFDNVNMSEAVARLRDLLDGDQPCQVSFVNPACVNIAAHDRGYRRVLARAGLVLPDGIGIKIGSDWLGTPLKQNVNGTDLFPRLCEMLAARGASLFLLGGQPGVPEAVAAEINKRWPGVRIAGTRDGFFSSAEEGDVAALVRASGADMMLVARGVPSQDLFIDRYLPLLGVKVAMGVGGLFDFVSGRISRAPLWMRETGLEWAYRLSREPGRMWRRYLVGNLTFLGRVLLQRLGLRQPAADALPVARSAAAQAAGRGVRAVIFATPAACAELPVAPGYPTALLPLGHQSVIERLMDQLNQAAITEVDVVVCEEPQALRRRLGDGGRWGLRLTWHLVKDPAHPYAALLPLLARGGARRWVLGHADHFIEASAVRRLASTELALTEPGAVSSDVAWTGWASATPAHLACVSAEHDRAALWAALRAQGLAEAALLPGEGQRLDTPASYLQAQFPHYAMPELGLDEPLAAPATASEQSVAAPPSWIRYSWGAASPQALVADGAVVAGPVLIGPGCVVERGAQLGPGVVLSRNVVVSSGTSISQSVVLPNSYIGRELELNGTLVNGPRVWHVRLGVEAAPAVGDAVLMSLATGRSAGPTLVGRLMALMTLPVVLPLLWLHRWGRRRAGLSPLWEQRPVVAGCDESGQVLRMEALRCPLEPQRWASRFWALLAGLIDVAAGRRAWFGMRPRSREQWLAMRPEWQGVLAGAHLGLLHAPAWSGEPASAEAQEEARAAADVFCAVLPPRRQGWHVLGAWWRMPLF